MQEKQEEDLQRRFNKVSEVGIDEVGKGAVFGPVFSAVVVLTEKNKFILKQLGVMDSKRLTPKKRKLLFPEILLEGCQSPKYFSIIFFTYIVLTSPLTIIVIFSGPK